MNKNNQKNMILKFLVSGLVILLTSWLTPGMSLKGSYLTAVWIAMVITFIQYLLARFLGLKRNKEAGFFVTALILYLAGRLVSSFNVTILGAIIGSFVIQIFEGLLPYGSFRDDD